MNILLNNTSMVPIYEQVSEQIKSAVVSGELKAGEALPSVRSLAGELKISALTVKKAYDYLESQGILVTVHGKGSYVSETNTELIAEARRQDVEKLFADAIEKAKTCGMSNEDIKGVIDILLED